jgi:predicted MFS family arabinose efflux permease
MPDSSSNNGKIKKFLFVPVLLISVFITWSYTAFYSTHLLDIALTFRISIGTASQALIVARVVGLLFSLLMGVLTIRFSHKSLFITGILLFGLAVLGSYLAPNFSSFLLCQIFLGIGFISVAIISLVLIGDFLPFEKRGWTIGLVVSAGLLAKVFVPLLSSVVSNMAGWRSVLIWFMIPIVIASFLSCLFIIPAKRQAITTNKQLYWSVFRKIFSNQSAVACLISLTLLAFLSVLPVFAVSFYRIAFHSSPITAAFYLSIAGVGGAIGGLVGGRLINIMGQKKIAVITALFSSCLTAVFTFIPNADISAVIWVASACILSMNLTSLHSLVLEQVPAHRGSMMSVESTFRNIGLILGVVFGGLILEMFSNNFRLLMFTMSLLAMISVPILLLKAKEILAD